MKSAESSRDTSRGAESTQAVHRPRRDRGATRRCHMEDDRLGLLCRLLSPIALAPESRVALTLRYVPG